MTQPIDNNLRRLQIIDRACNDLRKHGHGSTINLIQSAAKQGIAEAEAIQVRKGVNEVSGLKVKLTRKELNRSRAGL